KTTKPRRTSKEGWMNKEQLIEKLATKHGITKALALKVVNTTFAEIQAAAMDGRRVTIREFGAFFSRSVRQKGQRPDGSRFVRDATKAVRFTPYKASGGCTSGYSTCRTVPTVTPAPVPSEALVTAP